MILIDKDGTRFEVPDCWEVEVTTADEDGEVSAVLCLKRAVGDYAITLGWLPDTRMASSRYEIIAWDRNNELVEHRGMDAEEFLRVLAGDEQAIRDAVEGDHDEAP